MNLSELFEGGSTETQKKKRMVFYCICVTFSLIAIMLILLMITGISALISENANNKADEMGAQQSVGNTQITTLGEDAIYSGTLLMLDNANRYTGPDNTVTIRGREGRPKTQANGNVYTILASGTDENVDLRGTPEMIDAFNTMMKDFYSAKSDDNICITKAYTRATKDTIEPIYTSGNAVELGYYFDSESNATKTISGVDKYTWIYTNAYKYGFINVSAADGSGSGIFRYVGVAHATYMKTKNLDLNSYLEQLRSATPEAPLLTKIGRTTYASYFVPATGEHLVPTDYEYTVSGNNYDGYIITAIITTTSSKQT